MSEGEVRLNRFLAMSGVAARRKADALIAAGRVRVNGRDVPPGGILVRPAEDTVEVDGAPVRPAGTHSCFAVNKPAGYLSAAGDRGRRPLVTALVPQRERPPGLHPVGRLDLRSRGLMLLTDDGELSFRIQHPRHHVEKEYLVVVDGDLPEDVLEILRRGVELEEGRTAPAVFEALERGRRTTVRVVLRQGWKRQLRRSFDAVGTRVIDLLRVRIGPLALGGLPEGRWRRLDPSEVEELRMAVGLTP